LTPITLVQQANRSSGCGPACLAMVAHVEYADAVQAIFGDVRTRGLWTFWPDIRRGLRALGVDFAPRVHRHRSWSGITGLSIVKCGVNDDGTWHWVVYDARRVPSGQLGLVYDPLRKAPARPDGRWRSVCSHLPIF